MNANNKIEIPEKYEFLEVLGKGAQGIVYKVQYKETKEIFAAKKIVVRDSETYQNIKNQIKILQELNHENIIQVHEIINDDNNKCIYCVEEYFPCKTLQELLKSKHVFTSDQLKHIVTKILIALQYLHGQNICHRDLSLNNILICTEFKKVKLIDFGVAKKIMHSSKMMLSPVGKSANFPPEFECDGCYNTKYDIWLMGLLLLQIICKTQISSKTALQIVKGLKEKNPKYRESIVLSEECENLVGRFLEPIPDNRISATKALHHKWLKN